MSEDFDREDALLFFAQPYLFEPEYTDDELRELDVRMPAPASAAPHSCFVVLLLTHDWDIEEKKLLKKVIVFVFICTQKVL